MLPLFSWKTFSIKKATGESKFWCCCSNRLFQKNIYLWWKSLKWKFSLKSLHFSRKNCDLFCAISYSIFYILIPKTISLQRYSITYLIQEIMCFTISSCNTSGTTFLWIFLSACNYFLRSILSGIWVDKLQWPWHHSRQYHIYLESNIVYSKWQRSFKFTL